MILDFEPGDKVINPLAKEWGVGQIQSIIKEKVTVNFENVGKKVINSNYIELKKINDRNQYWKTYKRFNWYIFKCRQNFN